MPRRRFMIMLVFTLVLTCVTAYLSAETRQVDLSTTPSQAVLRNSDDLGFDVDFTVENLKLNTVQTKAGTFDELSIDNYGFSDRIGEAKLPALRKLIVVPVGATVDYSFISRETKNLSATELKLQHRIIPAQASISKSEDPAKVPFELKSSSYQRNSMSSNQLFTVNEIGFMRGVRVFEIIFEPVTYNPVTGDIQVTYKAQIRVRFNNPDLVATAELMNRTASVEWNRLYSSTIFNWNQEQSERLNLNRTPTKMLILCPVSYTSTLQPFVDWKIQQGIAVTVVTVGTTGTIANTTTAIKAYIQNIWDTATAQNPAPTYLVIVGDTGSTDGTIIANTGESSTAHVTDLTYVRLNGTDYLPEMYWGRFSVSTTAELTNAINKTLQFEKTLQPDLSYLGKVVMIAGADASYAPTYGNGQINYGTTHYFNSTNGITSNTYLYPASETSDAAIIANASEGRGYINYTAHGSETSWADPTFSVSDVATLTNTDKPYVAVGNCCITNKFNYTGGPCFGEALIRASNKGAVAYIGCTNNSYWDEDYWWGIGYKTPIQAAAHDYSATSLGAYDAMFHTHGEALADQAYTMGEINVMGNTSVQASSSTRKPYYWEIYHIMGDPSLMPYLGVPSVNTATYPTTILVGATSINVTAAAQSRVALTMNGTIYGTGIVGTGGTLALTITPFSSVGTAKLVITAQNKRTIIADVTIAPNSGPYITVDANTYNDANNSIAEYNETGRYTTTFKNVGSVAASNITATLTCSTSGITITDGTETIASLASGASTTITNAFSFTVANNIANQLSASFLITMVSGANNWTFPFTQTFNAPALSFGNITISDPTGNNNGRIDPGESFTVTIPLNNTGGAASPAGSATLTSPTTGITITTGTANFTAISASGNASLSFSGTCASSVTVGTAASFVFGATAGAYTASKNEAVAIGLIMEDFETGNFNAFPWTLGGTLPWTIDNTTYQTGAYSAKSGTITHSQSSTMETTRVLTTAGNLTFWYKVSSESGYDYLKFYVDGTIQNGTGFSGTVDWTQATYALTAGTHVLKWEYMKDSSVSSGSDCAWIDNINFPASTGVVNYNPPQNLAATASYGVVNLSWSAPASGTPTGYKIYKNSTLLTTITALSYTDTAVSNGTTYSYYLIAAYTGGESAATATVNATPNAIAPTNLIATAGNALVNLSWTAATGAKDDRSINGYKVYRNSTAIATVTTTTYQDTGLTNGTLYSYYVTTVYTNPAGESAASNTATATPTNVSVTEVVIGTGTTSTTTTTASPINVYYKSRHGQSVYTAAELNAAGVIGPINITGLPTVAMPNFIVRMKHTTATNVASAIAVDASNIVYSNASYLPTATGYNMYTLTTPFLWDGTSNILIDTAFGLTTGYTQTGTVQYTVVTSGYRYGQSDTADQTNVTPGSTSTYRPNVKLALLPVTPNPQISVNPTSLSFSATAVGTVSAAQNLTVTNSGGGTLSGTITTPAGFVVANAAKDTRNSLSFSLSAGASAQYNITFNPTAATSYSGNIVITSNSATQSTYNVAVTGTGYTPPTISVDAEQLAASLITGEESADFFTITNTGTQALTYSIGVSEVTRVGGTPGLGNGRDISTKSIAGSTFTCDVTEYTPGTTQTWTFSAYNGSTDTEWLEDIYLTIPAGVTVNSVSNFVGGSADMTPDQTSGTGITIHWNGSTSSGWGVIQGTQTGVASVNVTIPAGMSVPLDLAYQVNGDVYGAEPHTLSGTITLAASLPPVEWFSAEPLSGTIAAGGNQAINGYFSAIGMSEGLYEAVLTIASNDPVNPIKTVQLLMEVATGNHAPSIDIPATLTYEKNGSLMQSFASYIADSDNDPLTLNVSGNTNVLVDITGTMVTFTATQNWFGSEVLTFTVSDGARTASDAVTVTVTPTDTPSWTPVVYPNNPATIYAVVTINDIPAQLNDVVAAFVGNECRGTGNIVLVDRATAHATLIVNLAGDNETVTFKIYSYAQDTIYPVENELPVTTGGTYGDTTPIPLNGSDIVTLSAPAVTAVTTETGLRIAWNAVSNATNYKVYACDTPYGTFTLVGSTPNEYWDVDPALAMRFFYIVAEHTNPAK